MPTTTEHEDPVALDEKKKKKTTDEPRPENPGEIESVTIDDLNDRTERARRKGQSGE